MLIASLKETIAQQNNIIANQNKIIEDIRSDRATFQSEQQHLKEVEIFLLDRLTEVTARLGSITREIQAGQQ